MRLQLLHFWKRKKSYESLEEALKGIDVDKPVATIGSPNLPLAGLSLRLTNAAVSFPFRKGRIEVVLEVEAVVGYGFKVIEAYGEIRTASEGSGTVITGKLENSKEVRLRKTLGYLIGGRNHHRQLSKKAGLEHLGPLCTALEEIYRLQEFRKILPEYLPTDSSFSERLQELERIVSGYEQFVPLEPKQGQNLA